MTIIQAFISSLFWIGLIIVVLKMMKAEFNSSVKKKLFVMWIILLVIFYIIATFNFSSEMSKLMGDF